MAIRTTAANVDGEKGELGSYPPTPAGNPGPQAPLLWGSWLVVGMLRGLLSAWAPGPGELLGGARVWLWGVTVDDIMPRGLAIRLLQGVGDGLIEGQGTAFGPGGCECLWGQARFQGGKLRRVVEAGRSTQHCKPT